MKYSDLAFEEALATKWAVGQAEIRGEGILFVGDPLEESYEEALDGVNYTRELMRQTQISPHTYERAAHLHLMWMQVARSTLELIKDLEEAAQE